MPALVGDLVDPDPPQPVEAVDRGVDVRVDACHDRSDRPPRHTQQLHHRAFRGADREPGREIVEVAGMARAVPGPRHRRDDDAMIPAADPRRIGLEEHLRRAQIQCSPSPATLTVVVTR